MTFFQPQSYQSAAKAKQHHAGRLWYGSKSTWCRCDVIKISSQELSVTEIWGADVACIIIVIKEYISVVRFCPEQFAGPSNRSLVEFDAAGADHLRGNQGACFIILLYFIALTSDYSIPERIKYHPMCKRRAFNYWSERHRVGGGIDNGCSEVSLGAEIVRS